MQGDGFHPAFFYLCPECCRWQLELDKDQLTTLRNTNSQAEVEITKSRSGCHSIWQAVCPMMVNVAIVEQQARYRLLADVEFSGGFFDGV